MLLLLIHRFLLPEQPPALLPLVHLESPRVPLEVSQRLVPKHDRFLDRRIQELLVVTYENECSRLRREELLEPNNSFEILRAAASVTALAGMAGP